ncbi:MAG: NfeD family protein [Tissierellia bacterium]|nr:NfeD family protein [Tissierellia bacterium]
MKILEILNAPLSMSLIFTFAIIFLIAMLFRKEKLLNASISILFFLLFFYLNIKQGYADTYSVVMFIVGIILLTFEIFIPGFGVLGVTGSILLIVSIFLTVRDSFTGILTLLMSSIAIVSMIYIFINLGYNAKLFDRNILSTSLTKERGYNSKKDLSFLVGKIAKTKTILRPSGKIIVDDEVYEAISEGVFIEKGQDVKIVSIKNGDIVVKK